MRHEARGRRERELEATVARLQAEIDKLLTPAEVAGAALALETDNARLLAALEAMPCSCRAYGAAPEGEEIEEKVVQCDRCKAIGGDRSALNDLLDAAREEGRAEAALLYKIAQETGAAAEQRAMRFEKECDALRAQLAEVGEQLEHDRTLVAECLTAANRAIDSRHWLTEGRGSYEWNDDRWHDEFRQAAVEIKAAIEPMAKVAADWTACPMTGEKVAEARINLKAQLAEAERERKRAEQRAQEKHAQ